MRPAILPGAVLGIFSLTLAISAPVMPAALPSSTDSAPAAPAAEGAAPGSTAAPAQDKPASGTPAAPAAATVASSRAATGSAGHNPPAPRPPKRAPAKSADPMLAAFLGVIPLSSGFYLTSAPQKGLAFTLADAVLIGSIWNIRRDDKIPDGDVKPYFFLLGAVNLADAALSLWQARSDEAARITVRLNPSGEPVIGVAWHF